MAPNNNDYIVRDAANANEAHHIWWPLIKELQWNRSETDFATHWHVSRTSSWLVVYSKDDLSAKPDGCAVPFVFDNQTGWAGFFIMNEATRGRGWGAAMARSGLEEFKNRGCEYVGCDAVAVQVQTYERRGFRLVGTVIQNMMRSGLDEVPLREFGEVEAQSWSMRNIREVESKTLIDLEERITGFRRSKLWSYEAMWHRDGDDSFGYAAMGSLSQLEGFVLVRSCPLGFRFGPLYASSTRIASALLLAAMRRTAQIDKSGSLTAELYLGNTDTQKLFESFGWKDMGIDYHRMWLDGKATPQQTPGGEAETGMWAIFDAGQG